MGNFFRNTIRMYSSGFWLWAGIIFTLLGLADIIISYIKWQFKLRNVALLFLGISSLLSSGKFLKKWQLDSDALPYGIRFLFIMLLNIVFVIILILNFYFDWR